MTTINLNNSSEVVVLGTIDAGNDGQQILLALIKNFDPRNYQTSDFVFSAPVALTGQDTVVDVIAATANSPATAIVRNTRIFLTPKASTGLYGPKIIYYDRIHASDLPDTTVTKGTSTTVFDVLAKLNVKTGLGIKQEDVVDGPLPAADANGMVAVPLVFKPTSLVFYGTAKINAIDYQFGGNATYIASGTVFGQYCFGTNLMRVVADGTGGANVVLFEANSAVCPLPVAGADGLDGVKGDTGADGKTGKVQLPPIACSDEFTPLVVADDVVAFHWGIDQTFSSVWIGLTTVQTGGEPIAVNIKVDGLSILTTPITIDNGEQTSLTAQIQPVLTTNNIAKGRRVTICITHVGNGTATGLKVYWVSDENYLPDGLSDTIVLQSGVGRTFGHIYRFGNLPNGERDYSSDGYLESSAIDSLGNVISVGGCLSHDPAYAGSYVGAITKVNSQSQLIWEKNYTISTGNEIYGEMVVVDPSDNVYVFMTHRPLVDTNDPTLIGLLKLASNGDVLQQLTILTGDGVTNFNQAQVVADGILLSYQASVESVYTSTLTKIDFDGTVIWSISRSNGEEAPAFDVDADDSIYLAYGALTIPEGSPCIVEKYTSAGVLMWSNAVIITNAIASSNLYSSSVGSLGVTAQGIYVSVRGRDAFMHFDLLGNFVSAYKININNAPNGQRLLIWGMRAANNMLYISGELDGAPSGAFILQYSTITGIIECSAALQLEQVRNIYNWWSNSCVGSIDVRNGLIAVTGTSDSDGVVFLLENDIARYYGTQANQFAIDELPCTLVDVSPVFGAYAATIETLVTTTVTTPVTATLADINYYWESHYFLRPFALNVLGRVSTDHLSVGGVDLETLLARRAVTLESVTLECLVLTMADLENATNSMDETVQYYNVTTVVPSLHASWSTYNNCIELAKEGVYKVVLTCRAECLGDALTYRQWPADTAFVLGSEVSPYSSVLPEVMAVSARPHSPIPLSATQNNIEQWVDEYTFNWDGNGAGQIRPAMYSRTPNPELGLTILMKYDMSVSVTRLGHSVYVAPLM